MRLLGRVGFAAVALLAVAWALPSCGTTTTVSDPNLDAGGPMVNLDGGGVHPQPPDGVALCPPGACNYQSGLGCADGLGCRPLFSADSPKVAPSCQPAGKGVVGSTCATSAECAAGFFCAEGSCRKQCCAADWSACDDGESCIRQVQVHAGDQIVYSGLDLCFPVNDCDPLDTAPCPNAPTRECKIVDPTGAVACEPLSKAQEGDDCAPPAVCAAGLTCVAGSCRKLCKAVVGGGEPSCSRDQGTCTHFNRDPPDVGECTP